MEEVNPMFSAPIAGQSLTAEVGSQPWQKPPKLVTVQDAAAYYMKRILNPEALPILMDMMESGLALVVIADIFQTSSVMEGIHSLDVGILVIPVIMEALVYVAEENDIKYVLGTEKQKKRRAARNKARRHLERNGRVHKGDGKDVDHKDRNPHNNSSANIRVRSRSANRGDNK